MAERGGWLVTGRHRPRSERSLRLDRPHRFKVGDVVRHSDDEKTRGCEVVGLTLRVRSGMAAAYPTYSLKSLDQYDRGQIYEDVLCTFDLVSVSNG